MPLSEQSPAPAPISDKELAAHWDCSRPYVIKLRQQKSMPAFADLGEADAWRHLHAPPRGRRLTGKNRDEQAPQPPTGNGGANTEGEAGGESSAANTSAPRRAGDVVDIRKFIRKTDDFDGLALEQAERALQVAYGLLERAFRSADAVEISAALKNYNEAAKAAASARGAFLETREKSRALLPLDEVENVVGTELQELRNALLKHGERLALALAPHFTAEQLALIRKAADDDVDELFRKMEVVADRTRRELAS